MEEIRIVNCPECGTKMGHGLATCWHCWYHDKTEEEVLEEGNFCKCGISIHRMHNAEHCTHTDIPKKTKRLTKAQYEHLEYKGFDKFPESESKWITYPPEEQESYILSRIDTALVTRNEKEFMEWTTRLKQLKAGLV